ncbi:phosphosulfolactate synthase [Thermaerobacter litoralis]
MSLPAPWNGAVSPPVAGRPPKPRDRGLTMILDKGLGPAATQDLLEVAGHCIDYWKLAFGTPACYPPAVLKAKVQRIRAAGIAVYPGGTFLEVALVQGRFRAFVEAVREVGFTHVEVSDGTVDMAPEVRRDVIRALLAEGFGVVSEVGKKHPADRVSTLRLHQQVLDDLQAGVEKVIVEARESGKGIVIYDAQGRVDEDELEALVRGLPDPYVLIFEAPQVHQQQDLILRFGPAVNLGNVQPADVLALEALRHGLRGDTLRAALLSRPDLRAVRFPQG